MFFSTDIETSPLPEAYLRENNLLPEFEPPGNIKDPAKIAEREQAHIQKALSDAALSPITGSVCAVGWMIGADVKTYQSIMATDGVTELTLLKEFWRHVRSFAPSGHHSEPYRAQWPLALAEGFTRNPCCYISLGPQMESSLV